MSDAPARTPSEYARATLYSPFGANGNGGCLCAYVRSTCTACGPAGGGSGNASGSFDGCRGIRAIRCTSIRYGVRRSSGCGSSQRSTKRAQQIPHHRAADLQRDVVPGRTGPVAPIHRRLLRIAQMARVVAAAVAQVDPADERDVRGRIVAMPDDEQLLVVRGQPADPLVEQHLAHRPR